MSLATKAAARFSLFEGLAPSPKIQSQVMKQPRHGEKGVKA